MSQSTTPPARFEGRAQAEGVPDRKRLAAELKAALARQEAAAKKTPEEIASVPELDRLVREETALRVRITKIIENREGAYTAAAVEVGRLKAELRRTAPPELAALLQAIQKQCEELMTGEFKGAEFQAAAEYQAAAAELERLSAVRGKVEALTFEHVPDLDRVVEKLARESGVNPPGRGQNPAQEQALKGWGP
jgi:hypothetical protein